MLVCSNYGDIFGTSMKNYMFNQRRSDCDCYKSSACVINSLPLFLPAPNYKICLRDFLQYLNEEAYLPIIAIILAMIKNIRQIKTFCILVAFGSGYTNSANIDEVGALIIFLITSIFFLL